MIESMDLVALAIGILFGLLIFRKSTIDWILMLLHAGAFSNERNFYGLYDKLDDEESARMYKDHDKSVTKYADYLKLHAAARSSAYKTFGEMRKNLIRSLLLKVIPISLTPAVLFWNHWYFYVIGVAIALVIALAGELLRYGYRPAAKQRSVIFTTLSSYSKKEIQ